MRRLIQIVMVVALLLSGPVLPASVMPCCMGDGMLVKAAVATAAARDDGRMDMARCHSSEMDEAHVVGTAETLPAMDCISTVCAFRGGSQTATDDLWEQHDGAVPGASPDTVVAAVPVTAHAALSEPQPSPPSPLTATPLHLRV